MRKTIIFRNKKEVKTMPEGFDDENWVYNGMDIVNLDGVQQRRQNEQDSWSKEDNGWSDWFMDVDKESSR
jgi:hypothetical protein